MFLSKAILGEEVLVYEYSKDLKYTQSDNLHKELISLLYDGKINEAENILFDKFDSMDNNQIKVALDFYQRLNELDDEFLEENNFSRKEIEEGLRDIAKKVGMDTLDIII